MRDLLTCCYADLASSGRSPNAAEGLSLGDGQPQRARIFLVVA
jgi:hypothetical protein